VVLRVVYYTDEEGTRWAILLLMPVEDGIFFEYAPLREMEREELPVGTVLISSDRQRKSREFGG
jgi:hypothetical protein